MIMTLNDGVGGSGASPVNQSQGQIQAFRLTLQYQKGREGGTKEGGTLSCLIPLFGLCCILKLPSNPTQSQWPPPALFFFFFLSEIYTTPLPLTQKAPSCAPWHTLKSRCPLHQNTRYLCCPCLLCNYSICPEPALGMGKSHSYLPRVM
uniref:Uncharacterized protein n=1 Tax=Rousettus aegyptiacus TaxID=9407 RepID=A0A7J8FIZ5_ROUAE|nr:hypothetical protein HJG63_012109 [Rousettus aegyptiacus]